MQFHASSRVSIIRLLLNVAPFFVPVRTAEDYVGQILHFFSASHTHRDHLQQRRCAYEPGQVLKICVLRPVSRPTKSGRLVATSAVHCQPPSEDSTQTIRQQTEMSDGSPPSSFVHGSPHPTFQVGWTAACGH
eukprot:5230664-Amphidinium_carterae.1